MTQTLPEEICFVSESVKLWSKKIIIKVVNVVFYIINV